MEYASQATRIDAGWNSGLVESVRNWLHQQIAYYRTMNELKQLSDRELDDLGLSRAMLRDLAAEAARKV